MNRSSGTVAWRFLCDEGPYLDGTDLAPPPLAYFAAGMAAHNAALIREVAAGAGTRLGEWSLRQETFYTMEGSALQGTMTGGALPAKVRLESETAEVGVLPDLAAAGLRRSVAEAVMARAFSGTFSIHHNGVSIETGRVQQADQVPAEAGPDWMGFGEPLISGARSREIVSKVRAVEASGDPTHGQGASLRESQKRTLHLNTVVRQRDDGLQELTVDLLRPLGSTFRFLAVGPGTSKGQAAAPEGLDYLAAGIALCFLTQMGRYATITRGDLSAYSVVQDLIVSFEPVGVRALTTHAWVWSDEEADTVRRYVDMSEQTCFLHASCRSSNPTKIDTEGEHEGISD